MAKFWEVLRDELRVVRPDAEAPTGDSDADQKAHAARTVGLAFSGGGIRSATFNLGVIQALAKLKLLDKIDYLSTVSGGGYIGSWLSAWVRREAEKNADQPGVQSVQDELNRPASGDPEPGAVRFLRQYSNYLTPRLGFLSADTWSAVAAYIRNFLLMLSILVTFLASVLIVPRILASLFQEKRHSDWFQTTNTVICLVAGAVGLWFGGRELYRLHRETVHGGPPAEMNQHRILLAVVYPAIILFVFLGAFVVGLPLPLELTPKTAGAWTIRIDEQGDTGVFKVGLTKNESPDASPDQAWKVGVNQSAPSSGEGKPPPSGSLEINLAPHRPKSETPSCVTMTTGEIWVTLGPPLLGLLVFLASALVFGLFGGHWGDYDREWLSRLGGWVLSLGLVWLLFFSLSIFNPKIFILLFPYLGGWVHALVASGWVGATIAGILAANSPKTGSDEPNTLLEIVAKAAPYIFVFGLLAGMTLGIELFVRRFDLAGRPARLLGSCLVFASASVVLARFIDINRFSMHVFYRNRLVRAYLGASRKHLDERVPNPFTLFDPKDDKALAELVSGCPYHIVNTAMNTSGDEDLAFQERKGQSFILSPLYSGGEDTGYRLTKDYAKENPSHHLTLGTALAISGAAASPNMGYHTSPAVAFLLTVFNVRLGWWLANPRRETIWNGPHSRFELKYLLYELFGWTTDKENFVYLSDGGHFENLGLYELVRRRCRLVIACDGGADPDLVFEDLGNAIRKCRADFGVEIEIDTAPIRKQAETNRSLWHCVVGTVRYPEGEPGTLLYLKSSLTGDEPEDVLNYHAGHPAFPHQSTGDQWFSESQFESYRRLGLHVAETALTDSVEIAGGPRTDIEALIAALRQAWYPPSRAIHESFSKHGETCNAIYARIAADQNLKFLDEQIQPGWREAVGLVLSAQDGTGTAPVRTPDELRAGFYACTAMIQLLENVYLDLSLETEFDHPDNRGWMNVAAQWAQSDMFRLTWTLSANLYGVRFRRFCERRLGFASEEFKNAMFSLTPEQLGELRRIAESAVYNPVG